MNDAELLNTRRAEKNSSYSSNDIEKAKEMASEKPPKKDAASKENMIYRGKTAVSPSNRGFPGYLTTSEYNVFTEFRTQIRLRPEEFRSTIYSFGGVESGEEEHYALCRWLRARKYDIKNALQMVEEAKVRHETACQNRFYPDPKKALGVETSVFYSIFPELFIGYTKQNIPFYITKAGRTDLKHVSCVTTIPKMVNFHWHCMVHALGGRLREKKAKDPSFQRFEGFNIMDLEGLTLSNAMEAINVFKEISTLDQLCFPECLNRLIILNAPTAFSAFWAIAKTFIDARTAEKVEIYSSRKARWQKRLLELIPAEELPLDYGGTNSPYSEFFRKFTTDPGLVRQFTLPITVQRAASSYNIKDDLNLAEGECMELSGFTRSTKVGTFTVVAKDKVQQTVHVTHEESKTVEGLADLGEPPSRVIFPKLLEGPGKFQIRISCPVAKENFVLVGKIMEKENIDTQQRKSLTCTPHQIAIEEELCIQPDSTQVASPASCSSPILSLEDKDEENTDFDAQQRKLSSQEVNKTEEHQEEALELSTPYNHHDETKVSLVSSPSPMMSTTDEPPHGLNIKNECFNDVVFRSLERLFVCK
eukprot:CAMPEP_0195512554 /NCGR_PEP_ID=MMETSP0794_2-20130614/4469_1 /TAXON_ID=515487 /ORGANISM="Stephanopyxis turris, Strain CCMP 815" /LENGTH=588 /DNA_ID=CAMNT_0040640361 /DNA_START=173 /DNA_END=1939 /DNA_ORIENTATION=-